MPPDFDLFTPFLHHNWRVWAMQTVIFLTGVAEDGATTLKYANAHGPRFLTGYHTTNKLTAATLRLPSYHGPFLPRTGGPNPRSFFSISRSSVTRANSRFN